MKIFNYDMTIMIRFLFILLVPTSVWCVVIVMGTVVVQLLYRSDTRVQLRTDHGHNA